MVRRKEETISDRAMDSKSDQVIAGIDSLRSRAIFFLLLGIFICNSCRLVIRLAS